MKALITSLLLGLAVSFRPHAAAATEQRLHIPETYSLVNDYIGMLTPEQAQALALKLRALENHNATQIILLIVPTTGSEGIDAYSLRVVEAWDPGHNGESTAVLFAIDAAQGRYFIRTGGAIAGALPDVLVRRIATRHLIPHFQRQAWYEGIDATVDAMIEALWKEETAPPDWVTGWRLTPRGWAGIALIALALGYTAFHLMKWWRAARRRQVA